jgi:AcrR family transcriptional regulator
MSTEVNRISSSAPTTARAARGVATRAGLITAGRDLFGTRGFADTSLDDVVKAAQVTKGALYHHFRGKEDLFAAVYEQVLRDVSDRVVAEFLLPDPWEALVVGSDLWIDAHLDPTVQRIVMRDARAVLSWDTIRTMEARFGAVPIRGVLRRAMRTGSIGPQPLRPLALMIMGALNEACFYVATAEDTEAARDEVRSLTLQLLSGLGAGAHGADG